MNSRLNHAKVRVTVFTATYNRAHTLGRVYASLKQQSFRDFEWLIVDDGSTDGTYDLIRQWQASNPAFPLRYFPQDNAGKHIAHNHALQHASGEYFAILDSDDWYAADALRILVETWDAIPETQRASFANVEGLCVDHAGCLIGTPFPEDVFDSDAFSIRWQRKSMGDTRGMYRTRVLREFPFPNNFHRGVVTESLVWNRIANRYSTRFINRIIGHAEYQTQGLSQRAALDVAANAAPKLIIAREILCMRRPMPVRYRVRAGINCTRLALHCGLNIFRQINHTSKKIICLVLAPAGVLLYLRDRLRRHALRR